MGSSCSKSMVVMPGAGRTDPVEWVAWKLPEEGEVDYVTESSIVRLLALMDPGNI